MTTSEATEKCQSKKDSSKSAVLPASVPVILIGDSPAISTCAIYIHTANIPVLVLNTPSALAKTCTHIPGRPGVTAEEYRRDCLEQAKAMGITVLDCTALAVQESDDTFMVTINEQTVTGTCLVTDVAEGFPVSKRAFAVASNIQSDEALEVAGAGCRIAFYVKEILSKDS